MVNTANEIPWMPEAAGKKTVISSPCTTYTATSTAALISKPFTVSLSRDSFWNVSIISAGATTQSSTLDIWLSV